jgi:putative iron-dependent peroxidase
MASPQTGIFAIGTSAHGYLELDALPGVTTAELLRAVAELEEPHTTLGAVNLVIGIRPSLWPADRRPELTDFTAPVVGADGFTMPATQHDVWVWIAGAARDTVFDQVRCVVEALGSVASVATSDEGWDYHHGRDLIGFIDGTENPSLLEAPEVVLVPTARAGAGGAVVLIQRWLHDHESWRALAVAAQERVIGRTKPDSIELDHLPDDSHVARTVVEQDGREREIFRRNTPIGSLGESGTIFIGFSNDQALLHTMLERMAGADGGPRDALTRYTTPQSGSYYFCPSAEDLQSLRG